MSPDVQRYVAVLAAVAILLALLALARRAAATVIDDAPHVITGPERPEPRLICGPCGQPDDACTCADGLAAEITAYLADRPYDHERDGL